MEIYVRAGNDGLFAEDGSGETIMREINRLPQRCLWLLHLVINEVKN